MTGEYQLLDQQKFDSLATEQGAYHQLGMWLLQTLSAAKLMETPLSQATYTLAVGSSSKFILFIVGQKTIVVHRWWLICIQFEYVWIALFSLCGFWPCQATKASAHVLKLIEADAPAWRHKRWKHAEVCGRNKLAGWKSGIVKTCWKHHSNISEMFFFARFLFLFFSRLFSPAVIVGM